MPGTNDYLPFGISGAAVVLSQSAWAAATPAAGAGFGILPQPYFNKAVRQPAAMAAAIGAFISGEGFNALDDGNIPGLTTAFLNALLAAVGTGSGSTVIDLAHQFVRFTVAGIDVEIKWGTSGLFGVDSPANVVNFATPFATACLAVVATSSTDNSVSGVGTNYAWGIFAKTINGFKLNNDAAQSTFDWIALGH